MKTLTGRIVFYERFRWSKVYTSSVFRFTLACMGFLGFLLVNAMRVNISVALVDMVDDSSEDDNSTSNENCPISTSKNDSNNQQSGLQSFLKSSI